MKNEPCRPKRLSEYAQETGSKFNMLIRKFDMSAEERRSGKKKCSISFSVNMEQILRFREFIKKHEMSVERVVIVIVNFKDDFGLILAETIMPGLDWETKRKQGDVSHAVGITHRAFIESLLVSHDIEACKKLQQMKETAVVVIDHGVAEIYQL